MSKFIAGVMGPGDTASREEMDEAYELGKLIARRGWVLLTGGRDCGVMDAAGLGAGDAGGIVIGVLPGKDTDGMSASVDIPIITGMLDARNSINVLSSRVLFFIGMSAGTASELALAIKYRKPAILISQKEEVIRVFQSIGHGTLFISDTAASAVEIAGEF